MFDVIASEGERLHVQIKYVLMLKCILYTTAVFYIDIKHTENENHT